MGLMVLEKVVKQVKADPQKKAMKEKYTKNN